MRTSRSQAIWRTICAGLTLLLLSGLASGVCAHTQLATRPTGSAPLAISSVTRAGAGVAFWQRSAAEGIAADPQSPVADLRGAARPQAPGLTLAPLGSDAGPGGGGQASNRRALLPALMSALVPGAGQIRNGSLLRGLGYFAIEVTSWVARQSFEDDIGDKRGQLSSFAERYWDYDRYRRVTQNADSCDTHQCPYSNPRNGDPYWSAERDSTIAAEQAIGGERYREYITRDMYACGWDTPLSRDLYRSLWGEQDDLLSAKRFAGRVIFLNHLISAVDAFLEARRFRVKVGDSAELGLRLDCKPLKMSTRLMVTARFD
jgi:hypothetical protein